MSADHRKPVVAFVVLAFFAAALVGVHRADAQAGRFLAGVVGTDVRAEGAVSMATGDEEARRGVSDLGPAFPALSGGPDADDALSLALSRAERSSRVSREADRDRLPDLGGGAAGGRRTTPDVSAEHRALRARKAVGRAADARAEARGADGLGPRRHAHGARQSGERGEPATRRVG